MSSFSIDDVRETFTTDVSSFLGNIEEDMQLLLVAPALGDTSTQLPDGRPIFEAVADLGHAISGTAALVDARSLSDSAGTLEDLARAGQEAVRELERWAARARRVAELCLEGTQRMRTMLDLELASRAEEARSESRQWIDSVRASGQMASVGVAGDHAGAPADQDRGFDFSAATDVLPAVLDDVDAPSHFAFDEYLPTPSIGAELRQVFDEEAREALGALRRELGLLANSPADPGAMGSLERLYHTLKGAAATVGLSEVSERAAALQRRMESLLEAGGPVSSEAQADLLAETNEMLNLARLPSLEASAGADAPASATEQAHGFFLEEAKTALAEIEAALPALSGEEPEAAARNRGELRRLFHLLKGSALIVGESAIGEEAERIQVLLDGAESSAEELSPAVEAAAAMIRQRLAQPVATGPSVAEQPAAASRPVRRTVELAVNAELWDTFQQECRDLMETIDKELLALEESDQPKQSLEALMRHCHTLKGVVNTVGLTPSGEMLHKVEDLLEALMAAAILPPKRTVATLLLGVQDDLRSPRPRTASSTSTSPACRRASAVCWDGRRRPGRSRAVSASPASPARAAPSRGRASTASTAPGACAARGASAVSPVTRGSSARPPAATTGWSGGTSVWPPSGWTRS
jgi:chemotaxis protein histidine kinase CheA